MKLAFSISFIIFCKFSFAQIDIISESVVHPDSNVLFVGVENHLKLKGGKINHYVLVANDANILKFDGGFSIRVYNQNNTVLKLYRNMKLVLSKPFRVEVKGVPKAQLGGITDSVAKISEILANPFLHVVIPNCSYKHEYTITEFRLIIRRGFDTLSISMISPNIFSKSQSEMIKQLQVGDELLFSSIYATCPSCVRRKFPPFSIRIK